MFKTCSKAYHETVKSVEKQLRNKAVNPVLQDVIRAPKDFLDKWTS